MNTTILKINMIKYLATFFILFILPLHPVSAEDSWSTPFTGVSYLHRTGPNQLSAHAVLVDLCEQGIGVRHTAFSERGRTASSFAQLTGAQVVINGDWSCRPIDVGSNSPFPPCRGLPSYHTYGVAAHAGEPWPSNWSFDGLLAFAPGRVEMYDYNDHKAFAPWMREAMSGHFQLVRNGQVAGEAVMGNPIDRPPRSAIGLSEDRGQLILVTVDGRRSYVGMNEAEIAAFLVELGAHSAFGLDGGGSSTLWIQNQGVVNDPSDGGERVVGPHLGIFATGQGNPTYCDRPWSTHPSRPLPAVQTLGSPGGFFPRTPVRIYDTRNPAGSQNLNGLERGADQKPVAGSTFTFSSFAQYSVPANANAVAVNLTVANPSGWGFVTVWPGHLARPDTSNLNHDGTGSVANSALVHLGPSQELSLYSYASANHIADLTGWFAPDGAGLVPRTPRRVLDTRSSGPITATSSRTIMPAPQDGATAVALGVVALSSTQGYLTVYPCDQPRPDTSTVNYKANDIVSGSIIVPTGPEGVCAYSHGESHLLVDHYGSFIEGQGGLFQPVQPIRVIDTRSPSGRWVGRVPHDSEHRLQLSDMPNFPSNTQAVAVNLTAVDPAANGFAALGPCGDRGDASSINYTEGETTSTTSVVKVSNGELCVYVWGRTHILIDLVGLFLPPPDPCRDQPCQNGGSCISERSQYTCDCPAGFEGVNCEQNIDECDPSPCLNGGVCIDGIDQYTCDCPQGYSGQNCERMINDCADEPCLNGGLCQDTTDGYQCDCPAGFEGRHCEQNIDDCSSVDCEHGGLCIDLVQDYRCDCPEGFEGRHCELYQGAEEGGDEVPTQLDDQGTPPVTGGSTGESVGGSMGGSMGGPTAGSGTGSPDGAGDDQVEGQVQPVGGCAQSTRFPQGWLILFMLIFGFLTRSRTRVARVG